MDLNARYRTVWKILYKIASPFLKFIYNYSCEIVDTDEPCLIVSNHVTNLDPLLLALSFPKKNIHFVASEHLFRLGWVSKLITWLVAPIPRRKGANGTATAMDCLRKIRAGSAVCIFAEGETTWNGVTNKVFPATGSLARLSGAKLITYRFDNGYLTAPRWGKGVRRGGMQGHVVNTYSPEQLKAMTPAQIEDIMNADIFEDTWENQKKSPRAYKGRHLAEGMEVALFMCPECRKIGTMSTKGNKITCSCGFSRTVTQFGTFEPAAPFENIAQWDSWQHDHFKSGDFVHGETLFSDDGMTLFEISGARDEKTVARGIVTLKDSSIIIGKNTFPLTEISDMALIQRSRLALMHGDKYYELRGKKPLCLRKYLAAWENAAEDAKNASKAEGE